MKSMTFAIVALFATAAIASGTATTAPTAAPATAPAAATATTAAAAPAVEHDKCAKMTDKKEKEACMAAEKKAAKKH